MPSVDGVNYPGPWQIRIFYDALFSGTVYPHVLSMNVDVDADPGAGSPFADYSLPSRSGLFYNAETWTDAVVAVMQPLLHTSSNINRAELWKYDSGSENAAFQSTYDIGVAGTSATATAQDSQSIWSFRSQNGGHAYFEMLHTDQVPAARVAYAAMNARAQDVVDLITATQSPMLARDGGYLFSSIWFLPGSSELYFKKRWR